MGAGQSIPSTLTRQKVYELTRDTRGLMDILLDYMMKELTVRDFLALSNPTECKKYVIFMANNLYKHFYELQIVPIKDKKGVIAFRPVKELTNPSEDSDKQSLCLTLAYFYTRIFQIYGALALTVLDDAKVMIESGIVPLYSDNVKRGLMPPGYRPYVTSGGTQQPLPLPISSGGAIPAASLGNFNFLRSFLYDERDIQKGYLTLYSGEGNSRGRIYFLPKIEEKNEFGRPIVSTIISETKFQRGIFFIGYSGGKMYSQLEGYAKIEGIDADTKFTFGKLKFYKKEGIAPETIELPSDVITQRTITVDRERGARAYAYTIKGSSKTITDFFNEILTNVVAYIKRNTLDETTISSSSGIIISETGTAEELRLARIVQNLTKAKPLGHCLARAMQLLQTLPLKNEPAVSNICKAKFLEQTTVSSTGAKTVISRSGIPEPGAPLDTSPGMAALSQLFYDTVLVGTPRIVIGKTPYGPEKKSSLDQYVEFMKTMGRLFGNPPTNESAITSGLKGIRNKRDGELCTGITGSITVPKAIVSSVYDIVNQLYKTQVIHAAECGKIVKLLFDIDRDKSSGRYRIALSENIIKKGFPEIERINYIARSLLVKYYENCEMKYLQGMKLVIDAKQKANATSTP